MSLNERTLYRHTQAAPILFALLALPAVVCLLASFAIAAQHYILLTVGIVTGVLAFLFSSLTVTVSDRFLHWHFGPGVLRKKVALAQIAEHEITRTTWLEGWGIHYTGRGWLYNVSGLDAIWVKLKNGKRFLLGTNDPAMLHTILSQWRTQHGQ